MATLTQLMATGLPAQVVNHLFKTSTAASAGNVTLSTPMGVVKLGAGNSSLVLTNPLITANSLIFVTPRSADATAEEARVSDRAAGSCTIHCSANATAETQISYWIVPSRESLIGVGLSAQLVDALFGSSVAGSTGNVTLNTPMGVVKFAAAATSLTLTNNKIRSSSLIFTTILDNSVGMLKTLAVPANGSALIASDGGPAGTVNVAYWVIH